MKSCLLVLSFSWMEISFQVLFSRVYRKINTLYKDFWWPIVGFPNVIDTLLVSFNILELSEQKQQWFEQKIIALGKQVEYAITCQSP